VAERLCRPEAKRLRQTDTLGRDGKPALQKHPGGEGQVQEDMGEDDPMQPEDRDRGQAKSHEDGVQQT